MARRNHLITRAVFLGLLALLSCRPVDRPVTTYSGSRASLSQAVNLGEILSEGQTIRHSFRLVNELDRPLTVSEVFAMTPCCSAARAVPEVIPAHGEGRFDVQFTPGSIVGRKRLDFGMKTVEQSDETYRFSLFMNLVPEIEIRPEDDSDQELLVGESGRQRYRLITNRLGERGRHADTAQMHSPAIAASFDGAAETIQQSDQWMEYRRLITVELPPSFQSGPCAQELKITWSDGKDWVIPIRWQVSPAIVATPSGLLASLSSSPSKPASILLKSRDKPFPVERWSSTLPVRVLNHFPTDSSTSHRVDLEFSASGGQSSGDLVFETDHPNQPSVAVFVLAAPTGEDRP